MCSLMMNNFNTKISGIEIDNLKGLWMCAHIQGEFGASVVHAVALLPNKNAIYLSGHEKQKSHDYGYSSGNTGWNTGKKSSSGTNYFDKSSSGGFGDLIILFVIGIVIYALYKTCLTGNNQEMGDRQYRWMHLRTEFWATKIRIHLKWDRIVRLKLDNRINKKTKDWKYATIGP